MSTATLAAIKGQAKAKVPDVTSATEAVPETSVGADPWASILQTSRLVPAFVRGPLVDLDRDVPAPIRGLLTVSLAEYEESITGPNGVVLTANTAKFREFNAGTIERATEFLKLARLWAKNHRNADDELDPVSFRGFQTKAADNTASTVIRFAVMPLVKREPRNPGEATTTGDAAQIRAWAKASGMEVTSKGRVPQDLRERYQAAMQAEIVKADAEADALETEIQS